MTFEAVRLLLRVAMLGLLAVAVVRPDRFARRSWMPTWVVRVVAMVSIGLMLAGVYLQYGKQLLATESAATNTPAAPADKIESVKNDFRKQIAAYPAEIRDSQTTSACVSFQKEAVPWPEPFQNSDELKELAARTSCVCMMNALSRTDIYGKLETEIKHGEAFGVSIEKFPEATEIIVKACGQ